MLPDRWLAVSLLIFGVGIVFAARDKDGFVSMMFNILLIAVGAVGIASSLTEMLKLVGR